MVAGNASAEADLFSFRNRSEMGLQLKARLDGEAVNRRDVGEEVELQSVTTFLSGCTQQSIGNDDSRLAVKFDDFFGRFWIPCAKMLDDSISVLVFVRRHSFNLRAAAYLCQSSAPFFQR